MEAIAKATNVKISSQKAKLVMDLIRGRAYSEARDILKFTNKRAAGLIYKVLETARANAEQQAQSDNVIVDVDNLWVKECYADTGTTKHRRRVRPAPMGRAYRERRHYSHLTVVVSSESRGGKVEAAERG
ncbi:MAG TPA: 50S ribosomal protein L22 [Blastocatellia bacterium]|jgi:large subunit ribosomal protein L22|nr:50S ribosomal protein L22 [Blastocatellia bacterium]